MERLERGRKKWHVSKTFETEVGFTVEADTEEEANQLALEMDYDEAMARKDLKFSDEHINSIEEMMPTWHFTVWERLQRGVSVEAPDRESAGDFVRRLIDDGQILLDDHDSSDSGFDLDGRPDNPNGDRPDWYYTPNDDDDE